MSAVTACKAKTHLPRLLREVEPGERVVITRHASRRLALRARLPGIPLEDLLAAGHGGHKY